MLLFSYSACSASAVGYNMEMFLEVGPNVHNCVFTQCNQYLPEIHARALLLIANMEIWHNTHLWAEM